MAKNFECEAYSKDGSKMWLSANVRAVSKDGVVVGYEGMNEDITQRKMLEDQKISSARHTRWRPWVSWRVEWPMISTTHSA
jgi:hypothetical protein